MVKTCIQCGEDFNAPPSRAGLFCSTACMGQYRTGPNSPTWKGGLVTMNCVICGKAVQVKPSHLENGEGKTCSKACRIVWHAQRLSGRNNQRITKACQTCGALFEVKPSRDARSNYCSKACMAEGYKTRLSGSDNPHWKGGPAVQICEQCGAAYEASQSQLNSIGRRFCSVSCGATWRMLNQETTGRAVGGKRADLDNKYFRSSWEANYARYLNWLISLNQIGGWEYEVDTFTFPGIKRGNTTYIPDFKITNNDGSIEYHEVKGYMDDDSAVKLRRMAKFYPAVKLIVIDKDAYKAVEQQVCRFIPGWEKRRKRPNL